NAPAAHVSVMKRDAPSIKVSARMHNARRCAADVETIKIPSPEVTEANLIARSFHLVNGDFVGWAKRSVPTFQSEVVVVGTLCFPPPTQSPPPRRLQRLRGIDVEEGALAVDRDFGHGFGVLGDQVAGADVAVERHQLFEETARPQHGIAATAL